MFARPILIDCDPGIDDAVALLLAFAAPDRLDLRAVTTVAGNVPASTTALNARRIREIAGREETPIHAGCPRPILRAPVTAEAFHGAGGLDGIEPFEPKQPLDPAHAVETIRKALNSATEALTLVVTGPMTNVALAMIADPGAFDMVERLVVMAGADEAGGNITPYAEFNVFADPHAAAIVFGSGLPMTVFSLDATHQARCTPERITAFEAAGAAHAGALMRAANALEFNANGKGPAPLHDPCTVAWLLAPELFHGKAATVSVETAQGDRFGQTILEHGGVVDWITEVDADGVFALLCDRLGT